MKHAVRTYNGQATKCLYECLHQTAETAYEEYVDIIRNLKSHLPKGKEVIVARFNNGDLMTMETIIGTK